MLMPFRTSAAIKLFNQEAFHSIDRLVTGTAFDVQNEYGRFLDERLYQAELADRLAKHSLDVVREMKMTLTLGNSLPRRRSTRRERRGSSFRTPYLGAATNVSSRARYFLFNHGFCS